MPPSVEKIKQAGNPKGTFDAILQANPLFVDYLNQGRTQLGTISQGMKSVADFNAYLNAELNRLKAEDKQISNYYEIATGQKATPEVIKQYGQYASDPALLAAAINKGATLAPATGTQNELIASTIQEKLGRAPTQAELGYFGKQMEAGNLDAYGLGEFLQGTTEYQNKASDVARTKLAGELGGYDTEYLKKIQDQLESKYAQAGRKGASAFGSALIGAGKDLATERTGYLAGLGYQDFQSGQENLKNAYQNRLAQMYGQQQNTAALGSESRNRYYSQQDYDRQAAAQERLARLSQPKSSGSFLQNLVPGLITSGAQIAAAKIGQPKTNNYYGGY